MMTPQTIVMIRDLSRTLAEGRTETQLPISHVAYGEISLAISSVACFCQQIADENGCIVYRLTADQPQLLRDSIFAILTQALRRLAE
jgi:hypothetical protein